MSSRKRNPVGGEASVVDATPGSDGVPPAPPRPLAAPADGSSPFDSTPLAAPSVADRASVIVESQPSVARADPDDDSAPLAIMRSNHFSDGVPAPLAESIRWVVAKARLNDAAMPGRIGVVSAVPGEGVTTVSRALVIMMSQEMNEPACWVDLNWSASNASQDDERPGLYEVMSGTRELDDVLQWDEGAAILTTGNLPWWRSPRRGRPDRNIRQDTLFQSALLSRQPLVSN